MRRILSAAFLLPPLIVWLVYAPDWLFTFIVALAAAAAACEAAMLAAPERPGLVLPVVALAAFAYVWSFSVGWKGAVPAVVALMVGVVLALHASVAIRGRRTFEEVTTSSFAVVYVGGFLGYLIPIHAAPHGVWLVVLLFACVWNGDTLALLVGRRWGRHRLASRLSPHKTVEGALAGLVGSVAAAAIVKLTALAPLSWGAIISLALVMGVAGQLGDLMESLLKRCVGAKDAGGLIPGHGGVLDRIDGLLLAAPVSHFWITVVLQLPEK